jgi:hypothetical protein
MHFEIPSSQIMQIRGILSALGALFFTGAVAIVLIVIACVLEEKSKDKGRSETSVSR